MPTAQFSRTRLAPTPSGYLHLGNAASFLLTADLAKRFGAHLLLRIDDLDRERVRPEYIQDIFDTLEWLAVHWDEGPRGPAEFEAIFSQVHRKPLYDEALKMLKDRELLFACTCSRSQLASEGTTGYPGTCLHKNIPLDTPGASWRIRTPDDARVRMKTLSEGEILSSLPDTLRHAIVRKKNGEAAYQLASVVDDLHYGVDLIVRGEDLLDSTLVQLYIAKALEEPGFGKVVFHHHPLLKGPEESKLSKSAGASSIKSMKTTGMKPDDLLSLIAGIQGLDSTIHEW